MPSSTWLERAPRSQHNEEAVVVDTGAQVQLEEHVGRQEVDVER